MVNQSDEAAVSTLLSSFGETRISVVQPAILQLRTSVVRSMNCPFLLFEAGAATVTMLLVFLDGAAQPGISFLQRLFLSLREVRILKRGHNVIEFCFQMLKFCTEHGDLHFLPPALRKLP